jgi:mannose-1-phosphate guanylyltransferase/phosphomannomutase
MAFATGMPRGATVAVSRDTSRAARVLKQALTVGLNAAGANVIDLEVATVPVTRFGVRNEHSAGGVTVRLAYDDPQSVLLGFIDPAGIDISDVAQRKIERVFYREDFRRCLASETGDIVYPARIPDLYAQALVDQVDTGAIRAAHFKVVLDYAFGAASFVMPAVLGKLGAEVLSVNPYAAARRSVTFDRLEHARGVSTLVRAAGAHFGAVLGPDGERITLIDDNGRVLSDNEGLMALLGLVLGIPPGAASAAAPRSGLTVALPVSAPSAAAAMCQRAGAELLWTKLSRSHLMEVASRPGVDFAAGQEGGYIFPHFLPAYDAVAALAHTFALLAATGAKLSSVVAALPHVFSAHEAVVTPWEKKGVVMRSLMEMNEDKPTTLVDGVKVLHPDGWCLVVPDPDEALTNVWAEGASEAAARERARDYARAVRQVLRA